MDKDIKEALTVVTAVLELLNSNIEELDKRVNEIESNIDDEYFTIKIHKNASNLDVLRKLYGCKILDDLYDVSSDVSRVNLDGMTVFTNEWLKHKFFIGDEMNNEEFKKKFGIFS